MSINPPTIKFCWDIAQFVRSYRVEYSWQLTFLADGIVMRSSKTRQHRAAAHTQESSHYMSTSNPEMKFMYWASKDDKQAPQESFTVEGLSVAPSSAKL